MLCFESRVQRRVNIGRFGVLSLVPGFYLYVGSAQGPGGLRARVGRHARRSKSKRWHIDYLRIHVRLERVWWTCSHERLEGEWSHWLACMPFAKVPLAGFGASDCPGEEHLFLFNHLPDVNQLAESCNCQIESSPARRAR